MSHTHQVQANGNNTTLLILLHLCASLIPLPRLPLPPSARKRPRSEPKTTIDGDLIVITDSQGNDRRFPYDCIRHATRNGAIADAIFEGRISFHDVLHIGKHNMLRRIDNSIVDVAENNNLDRMKCLFEDEVSLDSRGNYDSTALHVAPREMTEYLILQGASINLTNEGGCTPLNWMIVGFQGRRSCIPAMLMNGGEMTTLVTPFNRAEIILHGKEFVSECGHLWDDMKANMWQPTRDMVLKCAIEVNEAPAEADGSLGTFIRDVPDAMIMMENIMSYLSIPNVEFDVDLNPFFLEMDGELYIQAATDVLKAFHSTTERSLPVSFFAPFINVGRREPLSEEWIRKMFKVLVMDRYYGFNEEDEDEDGERLIPEINLDLGSLSYDENTDIVSLGDNSEL